MHRGFIVLHRKIKDWQWYADSNAFKLFIHLLLTANHEPKKWQGIIVERGQLVTSTENLANSCCLSAQSTRTALAKLKSTGEVTSRATNKFTVVTVVNYESYQDKEAIATSKLTSRLTNEQQTTNKPLTTTKQLEPLEPLEIIIPAKKKKTPKDDSVTDQYVSEMKKLFPLKDFSTEIAKMKAWFLDNPDRKYNRKFFRNWIGKAKDVFSNDIFDDGPSQEQIDALDELGRKEHERYGGNTLSIF